jgi:glucosyl-dolichyl phosphate glucuronosyltransferase
VSGAGIEQSGLPTAQASCETLAIGLCTYNRGPAIIPTLEAIAALDDQQRRIAECIIVDNNSNDDTARVIDAFIASRPAAVPGSRANPDSPHSGGPVFRRVFEATQGQAEARRRFVRESAAPLLAFIDDDVIPDRRWASVILASLDRDPKIGVIGGRVRLRFESHATWWAREHAPALAAQDFGDAPRVLVNPRDNLAGAAMVLRRAALDTTTWIQNPTMGGRTASSLGSGDDHELCIRIRRADWTIAYEPGAIVEHCIPQRRTTREYILKLLRGISEADPWLDWLAAGEPTGEPGLAWITPRLARAKSKLTRTTWMEWRPRRRARRLAERRGRLAGLIALRKRLRGE